MEIAGLIWNDSLHYVDHLAPFCALLDCPLIVCDPMIAEICRGFYPDLHIEQLSLFSLQRDLPEIIITCEPRTLLEHALRLKLSRHKIGWLPHGMSDKGWKHPWFEALEKEDWLFVYGKRMRHVLRLKNISIPQLSIGNFRYKYFLKHQNFYEQKIQLPVQNFPFYAPTWEDAENNGTFFEALSKLPKNLSLTIKLHPNTEKKFLPKIEWYKGQYPHLHFIEPFYPIYPILQKASCYIGDMSSIGYDFLWFDKPLFFVRRQITDPSSDPSAYLMKAGKQILIKDLPYILEKLSLSNSFQSEQVAVRDEAFDKISSTFFRFSKGKFLQDNNFLNV